MIECPFSLDDEKLSTLLSAYSNWLSENDEDAKYPVKSRQKAKDLKESLLNPEYLSAVSDDELSKKIFAYSRTLEGPAHIRLGMPRISYHFDAGFRHCKTMAARSSQRKRAVWNCCVFASRTVETICH